MEEIKYPWPNVRRSFSKMRSSQPNSKTCCFVHHAYKYHSQDSEVAAAYMQCADMAVWAQKNNPSYSHPDALFMPIVYLYRHALELSLKSMIRTMHYSGRINVLPEKELENHKIMPLWNQVKPVLKATWPDDDDRPLKYTESLLNELHTLDDSGQGFRFTYNKNKKRNSDKYPDVVDLQKLQLAMNEIQTFLSCCEAFYYEEWQNQE